MIDLRSFGVGCVFCFAIFWLVVEVCDLVFYHRVRSAKSSRREIAQKQKRYDKGEYSDVCKLIRQAVNSRKFYVDHYGKLQTKYIDKLEKKGYKLVKIVETGNAGEVKHVGYRISWE